MVSSSVRSSAAPRFGAALLVALGAGVLPWGCSADEVVDPSYLRIELVPTDGSGSAPKAARVEVLSGTTSVATVCVNIDGGVGQVAASVVLSRDPAKDAATPVTIAVTAFESLSGQSNVERGAEFACPPQLPPSIGEPQTVSVGFCAKQAKRIRFHVGATCGCGGEGGGGAGGAGGGTTSSSSSSSSSSASSASSSSSGAGGGGSGSGGAGGAGGSTSSSSSSSTSSTSSSSSSASSASSSTGGPACGCGPAEVCGAGLSTEGKSCDPDQCCSTALTSACALEPAG